MLNPQTPAGWKRFFAIPLLAIAIAALLPGSGKAAASLSEPVTAAEPAAEKTAPPTDAGSFLEARDAYEQARAHFHDREYAQSLAQLDGAIRSLNFVLTHAEDPAVRRAAGDLLRRVGSLRLACTRALEDEKQQLAMVGPPSPVEPEADGAGTGADSAAAVAAEALAPAIESVDNSRVQKWMNFYTGRGRGTFEAWLKRSGMYMDWMKGILKSEGLPTDLVHLVFVESGFNPQAHSRSHAVGPWQFIRGTAKLFGLKVDRWIDERKDPEQATLAAARYLKHLYSLFESWPLALASYNAGEGTILRAISRQGTKDFWALNLPTETREYVPRFLACLSIAREPERYGFTGEREAPLTFDTVTLPRTTDLRAVAAACGVSLDVLRTLNPALLRHAAATNRLGLVTLRVPAGAGQRLQEGLQDGSLNLPAMSTPAGPDYVRYRVRRGETLATIARRYGVGVGELARANGLSSKARVRRGRTLRVPNGDVITYASYAPSQTRPAVTPARAERGRGAVPVYAGTRTIRVRAGDTLGTLAARYGTNVKTLRALNNLRSRQHIKAGARLRVPVDDDDRG